MRFGLFVKCPSMEMIESIGIVGCDFAVIDMEHTPLSPRDLYPLLLAAERRNLEIIVRIPVKSEQYFKWVKDLNISTIQVPHVQSAEDVKYAISNTLFAPTGQRGLCRFVRASDFSGKNKDQYLEYANSHNNLILQIEGMEAVKNIDEIIAAIPKGVSLFVGPYDLSQSMGKPGEIWDLEVQTTIQMIISKAKAKDIPIGTFTDSLEGIKKWKERGVDFIEYASDLNVFITATKNLLTIIRQ